MSNNIKTLIEFIFLVLGYYESLKAKDWYRMIIPNFPQRDMEHYVC
jgi:hypothetical protein